MFEYTAGSDRPWDARLLRYDILGSLGHAEGLLRSKLLTRAEHARLQQALRSALAAADAGAFKIEASCEDVHTAVEQWVTRVAPGIGEKLHTGRSRNDQVACDLRLYMRDALLSLHDQASALTAALLELAAHQRQTLWPGYTHTRRAMPSTVGLWAAAYAEGLLDTLELLASVFERVDRCPLGSAAGYGVPLPLRREAAMRALGFTALEHNVAAVQLGRGKLEACVMHLCCELAHDLGKLASDVILFSAEEFGYLRIPTALTTGSSVMPHKHNPDVFELTRARAAGVQADLVMLLQLSTKLTSGYHRDFQLLKEPLFRGLDRTLEMLAMMKVAVPMLELDVERCRAAVRGEVLATDLVLQRVEGGEAFRNAYRAVAAQLQAGEPSTSEPELPARILRRRGSAGSPGNLQLRVPKTRLARCRAWAGPVRARLQRVVRRLQGPAGGPGGPP